MSIELQSSFPLQHRQPLAAAGRQPEARTEAKQAAMPSQDLAKMRAKEASQQPDGAEGAARQVAEAAKRAADVMFRGREVEVQGFHDDGSGRFVYRISDKASGQVLAQTPPDALLRFYASYEGSSKPFLSVNA